MEHAITIRSTVALLGLVLCQSAWATSIFGIPSSYYTYSDPEAVAIGDVNADGRNDVLMTTYYYFDPANDYKLFVFLQDETGELAAPFKLATRATYDNPPSSVAVGDINNDGRADVVVGLCGLGLEIFYQDANGFGSSSDFIATPHSCVTRIGHLNGDNLLDVVAFGWQADAVAVFAQSVDGRLAVPQIWLGYHGGSDDLEVGDVNADGRTDIVVMSGQYYAYPNLSVLTQNVDGSFSTSFYDLGNGELARGVGVADIDGDGRRDVVVSFGGGTWTPGSIGVFRQETSGLLSPATIYSSAEYPGPIETGDFDGDGRDDLVVGHTDIGRLGVYRGADASSMVERLYETPYVTWLSSQGMAVGDINGDGAADVVVANGLGKLVVHRNLIPLNQPVVADAGPDSTVSQGSTVSLNGQGSYDPEGSIVSYEWRQVSGIPVTLTPTGSLGIVSFVAPIITTGESPQLVFELAVTPDIGATAFDQITITLNQPPVANAGADQTVAQGKTVYLDGSGSTDPNNAIVSYSWRQVSGVVVELQPTVTAGVVMFSAPRLRGASLAELAFELQVIDETGDSSTDSVLIHVTK